MTNKNHNLKAEVITIADIERWLNKLDTLHSLGARLVHVQGLLIKARSSILQKVEGVIEGKRIDPKKELVGYVSKDLELMERHGYNIACSDIKEAIKKLDE